MIILLVIFHVVICLFLIGVVLLQQGKSADLAGAFGGQGSQTAFGPRGAANLLTKLTTWSAILFMLTSITLTVACLAPAATTQYSPASPAARRPQRRSNLFQNLQCAGQSACAFCLPQVFLVKPPSLLKTPKPHGNTGENNPHKVA
jgi:preprotein translocase subunit SecG